VASYRATIDYLYQQLPMFHRIGPAAYKTDLTNTIALCDLLRHPEHSFRSIHIAGTNGKGSVSHLTASILQEAGFVTGLYTSPHLADFRERIRINGLPIGKKQVRKFIATYRDEFDRIRPSFFEMTVGMAFDHFRTHRVDMAVIETGLGGRLDSTNIIHPVLSVITNIGYDHTQFLGDTLEKIAAEKAGIIKPHIPVVIGETQDQVQDVFISRSVAMSAPLSFADRNFRLEISKGNKTGILLDGFDVWYGKKRVFQNVSSPLKGLYQQKNILTVLQIVLELRKSGLDLPDQAVFQGIARVIDNTGLKGRWQTLSSSPLTICDVGHNADGLQEVANQLASMKFEHLHFVLGLVSDKERENLFRLLPEGATYYFCKARIPRALDPHQLAMEAKMAGLNGKVFSSVKKAYAAARAVAGPADLIFIGGSNFVVAEVV
jgi:dihydrofolate synthase/folylpolyglutamate synthase